MSMAQSWAVQYEIDVQQQTNSGPYSLGEKERALNVKVRRQLDDVMPFDDVYKLSDCDLIYRFLISKKWQPDAAECALRSYLNFRHAKKLNTILADEVKPELSNVGISVYGLDKSGLPLLWMSIDPLELLPFLRSSEKDNVIREYLRALEMARHIAKVRGVDRCGCVLTLSKVSVSCVTSVTINFFREISNMLQNIYPEIMQRLFVFDSGWAAMNVWKVVKPIVDARIQKKLCFIKGSLQAHKLSEFVSPDNVLPAYGGTGTNDYVADCVALESKRIHGHHSILPTVPGATTMVKNDINSTATIVAHTKNKPTPLSFLPNSTTTTQHITPVPTSTTHVDPITDLRDLSIHSPPPLPLHRPDGTKHVHTVSLPMPHTSLTRSLDRETGLLYRAKERDIRARKDSVTLATSSTTTHNITEKMHGKGAVKRCESLLKSIAAFVQSADEGGDGMPASSDCDSMSSLYSCYSVHTHTSPLHLVHESCWTHPTDVTTTAASEQTVTTTNDRLTVFARDVQWACHSKQRRCNTPSPSRPTTPPPRPLQHSTERDVHMRNASNAVHEDDLYSALVQTCAESGDTGRTRASSVRAHTSPPSSARDVATEETCISDTHDAAEALVSVKSLSSSSSSCAGGSPANEEALTPAGVPAGESTTALEADSGGCVSAAGGVDATLVAGGGASWPDQRSRYVLTLPLRFERREDGALAGYGEDGICVSEHSHNELFISRAMLSILDAQQEQMCMTYPPQPSAPEQLLPPPQDASPANELRSSLRVRWEEDVYNMSTGSYGVGSDAVDSNPMGDACHADHSAEARHSGATYSPAESHDEVYRRTSPMHSCGAGEGRLTRQVGVSHVNRVTCREVNTSEESDEEGNHPNPNPHHRSRHTDKMLSRDENMDNNKNNNSSGSNNSNNTGCQANATDAHARKSSSSKVHEDDDKDQAAGVGSSSCSGGGVSSLCLSLYQLTRLRGKRRTEGGAEASPSGNAAASHIVLPNGVSFGTLLNETGHLVHKCIIFSNTRNERFMVRTSLIRKRMLVYQLDAPNAERGDAKTPSRGGASRSKMAIVLPPPVDRVQSSASGSDVSWVMYARSRHARWMFLRRFARKLGSSFRKPDEARQQKVATSAAQPTGGVGEVSPTNTENAGGILGFERPRRKGQILAEYRDGNLSLHTTPSSSSLHTLFALSLVITHTHYASVPNTTTESAPVLMLANGAENNAQ